MIYACRPGKGSLLQRRGQRKVVFFSSDLCLFRTIVYFPWAHDSTQSDLTQNLPQWNLPIRRFLLAAFERNQDLHPGVFLINPGSFGFHLPAQ